MLWDLIRDFFVEHVFGGWNSDGNPFAGYVGNFDTGDIGNEVYTSTLAFPIHSFDTDAKIQLNYITLGDWLSTTATIISITIIVVLCALFVYKIVRLIGGLIR